MQENKRVRREELEQENMVGIVAICLVSERQKQ
jgi:hypothetical protein